MKQQAKSNIGSFLVLLIFTMFAVCIMLVLLTGADVLRGFTRRDDITAERRTAVQYVTTRVRQADADDMVAVRRFSGQDALVLTQQIDGDFYETVVYCCDGYLREMFCEAGYMQDAEFGEKILPLAQFAAVDNGAFVEVHLTFADGHRENVMIALRSERSDGT